MCVCVCVTDIFPVSGVLSGGGACMSAVLSLAGLFSLSLTQCVSVSLAQQTQSGCVNTNWLFWDQEELESQRW